MSLGKENNSPWQRLALLVCFVGVLVWATILTMKFESFRYYDGDLALYANMMWNLAHGSVFSTLFGVNFLANHTQFIAFFIAPLYYFFPSPLLLIYLKIIALFVGAFFLFKIAQLYLKKSSVAFYIMVCFLLHPAIFFMLSREFHFEPLAIPFLFASFYFFSKDKWWLFMVMCLFLCLIKENLPAIVFMYGFLGVVKSKKFWSRWSICPWLLGGGALILCLFVLPPIFRHDLPNTSQVYLGLYNHVIPQEGSWWERFIQGIIVVFNKIISPQSIEYYANVFGGVGFVGIFAPHIWGLALPIFLQNILSNQEQQQLIYFHYATTIIPFIYCAAVIVLSWLSQSMRYVLVLLMLVVTTAHFAFYKGLIYDRVIHDYRPKHKYIVNHILNKVKSDEAIAANLTLLDHLTTRKELYSMLDVWRGKKYFTQNMNFYLPGHVQTVLMDFGSPNYKVKTITKKVRFDRLSFLYDSSWTATALLEDVALIRKNDQGLRFLDILSKTECDSLKPIDDVHNNIKLYNPTFQLVADGPFHVLDTTWVWGIHHHTQEYVSVAMMMKDQDKKVVYKKTRGLAYDLWPTFLWRTDQYIWERYRYAIPLLEAGKYDVYISLITLDETHNPILLEEESKYRIRDSIYIGSITITTNGIL